MAAQVVQNSGAQEVGRQKREAQNNSPQNGNGYTNDSQAALRRRVSERTPPTREQNPELLQWRANVLLDEMMLGAVDIAASDTVHTSSPLARPARNANSPTDQRSELTPSRQPSYPQPGRPTGYGNGAYDDGMGDEMPPTIATQPAAPSDPQDEWLRPSWHFAEPTTPVPPPTLPPSSSPS